MVLSHARDKAGTEEDDPPWPDARAPLASKTRPSRLKLAPGEKRYDFTPVASGICWLSPQSLRRRMGRPGRRWQGRQLDASRVGAATIMRRPTAFMSSIGGRRMMRRGRWHAATTPTLAGPRPSPTLSPAYARDLAARAPVPENATRITKNLIPSLATKPVGLLTARDLSAWRDGLISDGVKPATMVRLSRAVKAARNLAARRDPRIVESQRMGRRASAGSARASRRATFSGSTMTRYVRSSPRPTRWIAISAPYVEVAAETGARPSQISRLLVADLQNGTAPRLMMPSTARVSARKPSNRRSRFRKNWRQTLNCFRSKTERPYASHAPRWPALAGNRSRRLRPSVRESRRPSRPRCNVLCVEALIDHQVAARRRSNSGRRREPPTPASQWSNSDLFRTSLHILPTRWLGAGCSLRRRGPPTTSRNSFGVANHEKAGRRETSCAARSSTSTRPHLATSTSSRCGPR